MKTDEIEVEGAAGAPPRDAPIDEKIAWLDACRTGLDAQGLAVLDEVFPVFMRRHYGKVRRRALRWDVQGRHGAVIAAPAALQGLATSAQRMRRTAAGETPRSPPSARLPARSARTKAGGSAARSGVSRALIPETQASVLETRSA